MATQAEIDRYLADLETFVKDPAFKHKDFWQRESRRASGLDRRRPKLIIVFQTLRRLILARSLMKRQYRLSRKSSGRLSLIGLYR